MTSDQTLLMPKTKEEKVMGTDNRSNGESELTNVFDYYSKEALTTLKDTFYEAKKQKKSSVDPVDLLRVLISKDLKLELVGKESLLIIQERLIKHAPDKGKTYDGIVYFAPEIKEVLIGAYFISKQESSSEVLNSHLLLAISVHPSTDFIFSDVDLKSKNQNNLSISGSMEKFTVDLTSTSKNKATVYQDRKKELDSIVRILIRENKHHLILLGEEGVGKSTLGIALAQFLSSQNLSSFEDTRVISLDVGSLFALSLNSSQENIRKITEEVGTFGKVIFFFDNVDLLRTTIQMSQLVEFLRNLEKKGSVNFVVPTTPVFYKEFLATNPYFTSSFDSIKVEEVST
ncbi:MAG TPA: AAA family ATPase, partial [Candidatus Methanoperedens sp.]|nr:AAA family ATPase [Candidatus Methanoperedens sp.]